VILGFLKRCKIKPLKHSDSITRPFIQVVVDPVTVAKKLVVKIEAGGFHVMIDFISRVLTATWEDSEDTKVLESWEDSDTVTGTVTVKEIRRSFSYGEVRNCGDDRVSDIDFKADHINIDHPTRGITISVCLYGPGMEISPERNYCFTIVKNFKDGALYVTKQPKYRLLKKFQFTVGLLKVHVAVRR
jgi:hypothetical protein